MGKKATKKAKMGRPPKQGEKMIDRLVVQVEPERKRRYFEAAAREGLDVSQWIRLNLDRIAAQVLDRK